MNNQLTTSSENEGNKDKHVKINMNLHKKNSVGKEINSKLERM